MRTRHFLNDVEHEEIDQAIRAAEEKTSGRIVVYISRRPVEDALSKGNRLFHKFHLETKAKKAGLLLFVAPASQKFAVVGGSGLHEKIGPVGWARLAGIMSGHFREKRYAEGLLAVIREAGELFHAHFPLAKASHAKGPDLVEE